jgi:DNA excision repair protein ERCC-5
MKYFINEAHLEDLDFDSPEFKALPTEVQYEFVGDMRVRSRQPNSQRLANMLKASTSAMDFSKAQIKGLSQRNSLTQQLLTVTDTIGKANITIPVRVAAERNREYVLVKKTEEQGGGWALGIRDQGTKAKPIKIDQSPQKEVRPSAKPRISSDGYLGKRRRSDDDDEEDDDEDFEMLPK